MRNVVSLAVLILCSAVAATAGPRRITADDFGALPPADVVILGEIHDNPTHHANQSAAVAALGVKALVFEMLSERQALAIRPEMLGDEGRLAATLGWADSGWPDFGMYYPVFRAAKTRPIYGGAVARDAARQAVAEGAAAVLGDAAVLFGLDKPLDADEQATREAGQMAAHCDALPVEILPGMVEAQRLRDAALARAVIAAFAETGGPVAVITGNGHGRRDWGIPRALALAAPDLKVLSIAQFESVPDEVVPFDLWLVTDPAERDDPCTGFTRQ